MGKETDVTLDRNRGIGGSDVASVMGDSPFLSRWDLLQQKVGLIERDFKGNEYTRYGQVIEPKIRDYINKTRNANFEPDYVEENADDPISYYYHSDGCDTKSETILEIKSTSVIAAPGEEKKVYKHYYEQLLYGMWLHGYMKGILAVYERPEDMSEEFDPWRLQTFEVNMNEWLPFMHFIQSALVDFKADWKWLDKNRDISESELPSRMSCLATVQNTYEIGGMLLPLGWLLRYEKEIVDISKSTKDKLCEQMLEHDIKTVNFSDLGIKATCVPKGEDKVTQKFDEKKFASDFPDLYRQYLKEDVKKGKSEYVRITVQGKAE